jgi:hypothetical protein
MITKPDSITSIDSDYNILNINDIILGSLVTDFVDTITASIKYYTVDYSPTQMTPKKTNQNPHHQLPQQIM